MKTRILLFAVLLLSAAWSNAQSTTAFTFQGQLNSNGVAASGLYDLQFTLYDNATAGNVIAGPVTNLAATVSNGLFAAQIDFGASPFSGPARWLQVGVRSSTNGAAAFAALTPRSQITSAPYSISAYNLAGPLASTNISGLISAANLPAGLVTNNSTSLTLSGTFNGTHTGIFSGSGAGLTNLAAANLTGTVAAANLPATLLTNSQTGVTLSGTLSGNGAGLTNLAAANLTGPIGAANLPASALTNTETGVTLAGTFTGNGAGLTALNASALSSGTVGLAELPIGGANGLVANGSTFVNLSGNFSGFFNGNGSGLNSLSAGNLTGSVPVSALTSVPAANLTGTVPSGALLGAYTNALTLSSPANVLNGIILNSTSTSLTNAVGTLTVTNAALFTNNVALTITNNNGAGIILTPGGITNSGNVRIGGWLVGPTTNAGGFWITNGTLFVTNQGTLNGVIIGGNSGNITFSGSLTGNGSALTNSAGNAFADSTVVASGDGSLTNYVNATSNGLWTDIQNTNAIQVATNGVLQGEINAHSALFTTTSNGLWADIQNTNAIQVATNGVLQTEINANATAILNGDTASTNYIVATSNGLWTDIQNTNAIQVATNGVLQAQITANAGSGGTPAYVSAYATGTQEGTSGSAITLTVALASGWSLVSGTELEPTASGTYLVQYTAWVFSDGTETYSLAAEANANPITGGTVYAPGDLSNQYGVLPLTTSFIVQLTASEPLTFVYTNPGDGHAYLVAGDPHSNPGNNCFQVTATRLGP